MKANHLMNHHVQHHCDRLQRSETMVQTGNVPVPVHWGHGCFPLVEPTMSKHNMQMKITLHSTLTHAHAHQYKSQSLYVCIQVTKDKKITKTDYKKEIKTIVYLLCGKLIWLLVGYNCKIYGTPRSVNLNDIV